LEILKLYDKITEQTSLEQMLDVYADRLIGYIMTYTKDIYSAEDIMMDTFVSLIDKKPSFDCEQKLCSWLFTTARNKAINQLKRNNKCVPLSEELLNSTDNVENNICKSSLHKVLQNEMKTLPQRYQEVLYLSYFEEMSIEEVSQVLNLDLRQTYNLKHRAKKKLNQKLKKQGFIFEEKEAENENK